MATFTSATSGNWNVAATWGKDGLSGSGSPVAGTHYPQNSDEAHIDSGHTVTLVADVSVGNVVIDGGTLAGGGYKITCVKTSGRLFDHSGTISGVLDLELQGTHTTTEDFMGTGNVRNLTINGSGLNVTTGRETTLDGTLTITQGTLTTGNDGLTTGSHLSIAANGTLNGSGTANHSFTTLTIASGGVYNATSGRTTITAASGAPVNGRCWYVPNTAGAFVHNKGLVKFTASSPQVEPVSNGGSATNTPFYDIEQTSGTIQWKGEHNKVLNNATIRGSQFNGSTGNLTVLGICRLTAQTFNASDTSTRDTSFFQTLIIESGATVDLSALDITVGTLRNLGGTIQ